MSGLFGRAVLLGVAVTMGAAVAGQGQPPTPPPAQPPAQPPPKTAPPTPESRARADQVLAEARKALGGDKLAAVKKLVASGRTKRVRGNNLVPIEFELFLELPDKYLRADEFPAEDTDPTSSGFNGDALIQIPPPPSGPTPGGPTGRAGGVPPGAAPPAGATPPAAAPPSGATPPAAAPPGGATPPAAAPPSGAKPPAGATPGAASPSQGGPPAGGRGPAMDPRRARVISIKQDLARLTLGLFAAPPAAYPLTFSYAAIAEAPQGKADVLDVKGEGNFTLRYFINSETRLPVMVTWTTPPTNVIVTIPGKPAPASVAPGAVVVTGPPAPAAGASKEETDKYAKEVLALRSKAQATPVEHRLYFADYRDVDGVKFPFRLRRAIGTETTEETTFDRFRVNAKIDPRKFEAVK
jgi:hypothetical protein